MRTKLMLAALLAATAAGPPALAQNQDVGGVQTETQRRLARGDAGVPWDLFGLFGLLGLLGLRKRHPDDSYHPSSLE